MFQMSLKCIILWLSFLLVDCQMTSFNPERRYLHTTAHIDNKLYILGGTLLNSKNLTSEFFYLDVSGPFNTKRLSWQNLSNNTIPAHSGAAAVVGGENNNTLILYGGDTNDATMALVYTFDPIGKTWASRLNDSQLSRKWLTGVNNNGNVYLWGGVNGNDTNDMLILRTIGSLSLDILRDSIDAPSARHSYGAVLLPNQNIIYFGGYIYDVGEVSLTEIYLYDTFTDKWSMNQTTGIHISERDSFSAVLGLDGQRIIIFGGSSSDTDAPLVYEDSLYVLNLKSYEWTLPKSSGDKPKPRNYHKANVIGKYMVISFGSGYDQSTESDILLLDISNNDNYIWTNTFNLSSSYPSQSTQTGNIKSPADSPDNKPNNSNNSALIGAIIGSLIGGSLLSFGSFFLYKWNKNIRKQKNVVQIPGNDNQAERNIQNIQNDYGQEISTTNHESIIVQAPTPSFNYYGSEENLSRQSINDFKNELKQEIIQGLRQEIMQNNNLVKK